MVKNKKIDIRVDEEVFEKLLLIVWFLGKKRSDFIREVIDDFLNNGSVEVDGQSLWVEDVLLRAAKKLSEEGKTIENLKTPKKVDKDKELPVALEDELQNFADRYAAQAIEAYKKYVNKDAGIRDE